MFINVFTLLNTMFQLENFSVAKETSYQDVAIDQNVSAYNYQGIFQESLTYPLLSKHAWISGVT